MMELRFLDGKLQYRDLSHPQMQNWYDVPKVESEKKMDFGPTICHCHNVKLHECPDNLEFIESMVKAKEAAHGKEWKCPVCLATKLDNFCGYDGTPRPKSKESLHPLVVKMYKELKKEHTKEEVDALVRAYLNE